MAHIKQRSGRISFPVIANIPNPSFCAVTFGQHRSPISVTADVTTLGLLSRRMSSSRLSPSPTATVGMLRFSSLIFSLQIPSARWKLSYSPTTVATWITLRSTAVRILIQYRTSSVLKSLHITSILLPHRAPNHAMERTADRRTLHF